MRVVTFNESLAYQLYHKLKNDTEIASRVGTRPNSIALWRRRKNLPSIALDSRKDSTWIQHCDYREALTLKQSAEMNRFLKCLSDGARKASQAGIKVDVGAAIYAWRG